MARYGVGHFLASLVVKKYSLFDPLVEKNKGGSVGGCIF